MRLHRFIGKFEELGQGRIAITDLSAIHQMIRVLRLRKGDLLILIMNESEEVESKIESVAKDRIVASVLERREIHTESQMPIILACAVLKKENFEWVVQKAVEVGATEIIPLITEHTVKMSLNTIRLSVIAREAAEQSGRARIPVIQEPVNFADALVLHPELPHYFFDTNEEKKSDRPDVKKGAMVFIGPEGGWSEEERVLAKEHKMKSYSLGSRILRGETAAIIATYLFAMQGE